MCVACACDGAYARGMNHFVKAIRVQHVLAGFCVALLGTASAAWAQSTPALETTLHNFDKPVTAFAAIAAALGFGHVAGLGLPLLILTLGSLRLFGVWPAWLQPLVDESNTLWSWPFMALSAGIVLLHALSSSSKITKAFPLVAHLAGVAPSAAFVFASPLLTMLATRAPSVGSGESDGSTLSVGFLLLLGAVATLSFLLMSAVRLLVHVLVWLSPFPLLDLAITIGFHVYAAVLVVLAIAWPEAALALAVVQTVVGVVVLRKLMRLGRAMFDVVLGALRWHSDVPADDVAAETGAQLDGMDASPVRAEGFAQRLPGVPRFARVVVGGRGDHLVIVAGKQTFADVRATRVREGVLHDEVYATLPTGHDIVIGTLKSHRTQLRKMAQQWQLAA
jgi:hypothetical protein